MKASKSYFLSYLLGQDILIAYRGENVKVWRLRGTSGIYIDQQGRVYIQRWEADKERGSTPAQRSRYIWKPSERKFYRFDEGITSASRGLRQAQRSAWLKYIPRYEKVKEVAEKELREKIITKAFFRWENLGHAFKEKILQVGYILGQALSIELTEGFSQISFLLIDAHGRLNVGAALARTAALSDRLYERLKAIYSWLPVFSGREQGLAVIDREFRRLEKKLEGELKRWGRHSALIRGRTTEIQQKLLNDKITAMAGPLRPFVELRPFGRWVSFTISDLEQAAGAIRQEKYFLAKAILERIRVATEVKKLQWALDELLEDIQAHWASGNGRREIYFQRLLILRGKFRDLAADEKRVGFVEPVSHAVAEYLNEAALVFKEKSLQKILRPIKKAYLLF